MSESIHYASLSATACFQPVIHSSMSQELLENHLCNQSGHYKKIQTASMKPSHATTKSTLVAINKDEQNTKEDTGELMKNALYTLWYVKSHLLS